MVFSIRGSFTSVTVYVFSLFFVSVDVFLFKRWYLLGLLFESFMMFLFFSIFLK